jgi:hypothetical protein
VCQGNRPARFGKGPTEKDPNHGHLAGGLLHSAGGPQKPTGGNPGRALRSDPTPDQVEHSWVGRTGDGYRYDHAFCSPALAGHLTACHYLHQPRHDRLSDHSALTVRLTLPPPPPLLTSDPAGAAEPATLF